MATWSWDDIDWGDKEPIPRPGKPARGGGRRMGKSSVERVERVRQEAAKGITAAEAGKVLGMTRNAVLGLAHRNGIRFYGASWAGQPPKNTEESREVVRKWMASHPFAQHKECAAAMGFSAPTMRKIANQLRAEWKNKND